MKPRFNSYFLLNTLQIARYGDENEGIHTFVDSEFFRKV